MLILPQGIYARAVADLPAPGTMITQSVSYTPAIVEGITIYPETPLQFDFIIDIGDDGLQGEALKKEVEKLVSYFMATLTVPEDEMWVNLSPYEKDRIIADGLGNTVMGRDMLAQDYILKQLTASMLYPEDKLGNEFWQRVYKKAQEKFGTTNIPTHTFNKIWIIPDEAIIYANGTNIFVADSRLKVMLEEDYLVLEHHDKGLDAYSDKADLTKETKAILKEILLPEIEREVNEGKNFATLRQIYHSMILATWYKKNFKASFLGNVYINQNKINGVDVEDKDIKNKIYNQYVEAFKKGVYDYIKEDYDELTQDIIPRKYFSGGLGLDKVSDASKNTDSLQASHKLNQRKDKPKVRARVKGHLEVSFPAEGDNAIVSFEALSQKFGEAVHQEGNEIVFLRQEIRFAGSQGESPVGTMVANPTRIRFDVRVLGNAQGNLSIFDRKSNKRRYQPTSEEAPTSDSKRIYSLFLPFDEAMTTSLEANPGNQALTWLDFSNNFGNPEHISFFNGQVNYPTGYNLGKKFEQSFENPFYSVVQHTDGRIEFAYVRYEITNVERVEGYYERVSAKAFIGESELDPNTVIFSAIPLIVQGQRIDLSDAIRKGIFQDLRSLFSLVPIKHPRRAGDTAYADSRVSEAQQDGVFFGLGQLSDNDYEKAAQALNGPVTLSTTLPIAEGEDIAFTREEMKKVLLAGGYVEETDASRVQAGQPEEGKYIFTSDNEILIYIRPNVYPHQLVGRTNDGNIFIQAIGGASGRVGVSVKDLFEYAERMGLTDLMTISQGTGVLLGYNDQGQPDFESYRAIVSPSRGRRVGSAVINILKDNAMVSSPSDVKTGGIDFNANNLNMKFEGEEIKFSIPAGFQGIQPNHVNGLTPVIINIVPITNFTLLLGLSDRIKSDNQQLSQLHL